MSSREETEWHCSETKRGRERARARDGEREREKSDTDIDQGRRSWVQSFILDTMLYNDQQGRRVL